MRPRDRARTADEPRTSPRHPAHTRTHAPASRAPADDLAELLRQWSDTQLAAMDRRDKPVEEAARSGSLLRPGATEETVSVAEERLGTRFPPSYRAFLLLSDGAYGDVMGPVRAVGADGPFGFLPAAEVSWFRDFDPDTVAIWLAAQDQIDEAAGGPSTTQVHEWGEVPDHRPIGDALLISPGFDANCSLLVPVGNPGPEDEWEVWDHYKEGSSRWSSFAAFLRDAVEMQVGIEADEDEVRRLLAAAQDGDARAPIDLGRVRSAAAAPLLMEIARDGRIRSAALEALGRIGGAEVVEFLADLAVEPWQDRERYRALARIGSSAARDVLVAQSAFYELAQIGDPRAAEVAATELRSPTDTTSVPSAANVLGADGDPRWVPDLLAALERTTIDQYRVSLLHALHACGADDVVRRVAPDLRGGPYTAAAQALLDDI